MATRKKSPQEGIDHDQQAPRHLDAASSECGRDPVHKDPRTLAWERLESSFTTDLFTGHPVLAQELSVGQTVIGRMLRCQESEADTLVAIRALVQKVSALITFGQHNKLFPDDAENFSSNLRTALEEVCWLAAPGENKKTSAPCGAEASGTVSSNYAQLIELERINKQLQKMFHERTLPAMQELLSLSQPSIDSILDGVKDFETAVNSYRAAAGSCNELDIYNAHKALRYAGAKLTSALDEVWCQIRQGSYAAQSAFLAAQQAEMNCFAFLLATAIRAIGRMSQPCNRLETQLSAVWTGMLNYLDGPLKRAFVQYEQHELCPPTLCYDKATGSLREAIKQGLANAPGLAFDIYGCDEAQLRQHRHLVDKVVYEISRLDSKNLEGFDRCVWTELGADAMRLYAILGRGATVVADQVRTLYQSWAGFTNWFAEMRNGQEGPPPADALPFLRAGLGILRTFEARARNSGVCLDTQAPCGVEYGEMVVQLVDENDQPFAGTEVQITPSPAVAPQFPGSPLAVTDQAGIVRRYVPKGSYTVSALSGVAAFPAVTITVV
ncbi:MAG: hypothetical protein ABSG65_18960 [Bryobacteraceae bacterium]|jgi:hypothetical protein